MFLSSYFTISFFITLTMSYIIRVGFRKLTNKNDYNKMLNKPPPTATSGENSFFKRAKDFINETQNTIGYFEPDIGGLHPDFLLLSPDFGVIVVEIKDYSPNNLLTIAKSGNWEILDDNKKVSINNPFDQIYQYWRAIMDRITITP